MKLTVENKIDNIMKKLDDMTSRTRGFRAYLNRVVYRKYQQLQIRRWNTENASEGAKWKPLNPTYAAYKLKKYASRPYGGSRMLVATGTLFESVVGTNTRFHRKIVTDYGISIMTTLEYAPYVAKIRPFMEWSRQSKREIIDGMRRYLVWGRE